LVGNSLFIDFTIPETIEELSEYIGGIDGITELLFHKEQKKRFFKEHFIPKYNYESEHGGYRHVWEPTYEAGLIYKSFTRRFNHFVESTCDKYPHPNVFGYTKGRSTYDNALKHIGAPLLLKADIRSFFPSISFERIYETFTKLGVKPIASEMLTTFVTIEDILPLGLHSSPIISNICCLELDEKLLNLSSRLGATYTRYADDISISGNNIPSKTDLIEILASEGFELAEHKFRTSKLGQAHFVTGLSISDTNAPHVPKKMKHRLRQELHFCQKFGIRQHIINKFGSLTQLQNHINRIDGMVRYVSHIEKSNKAILRKTWNNILERDQLGASYSPLNLQNMSHYRMYIDEAVFKIGNTEFIAIGIAETEYFEDAEEVTKEILKKYIVSPFTPGRKKKLEKKNLHFTDAHPDLRRNYIDRVCTLPLNGYIAFARLKSFSSYSEAYLSLLHKLLPDRLKRLDGATLEIIIEENSQVTLNKVNECIHNILSELETTNNRRPKMTSHAIASKNEYYGFSLPDFLLGLFMKYTLCSPIKGQPTPLDILNFEKIRDKIRVILDADTAITYSRKRPYLADIAE